MNKIIKLSVMATLLNTVLIASTQDSDSINVYGVGQNLNEKSYSGVGFEYENNFSNVIVEKGSNYNKVSGVLKFDIIDYIYSKIGLGYLKRNIIINNSDTDVTQNTGGVAFGFGDNQNYNLEVGHIVSKLSNASNADGYSRISFVEALAIYEGFDAVGIYKNTNVFSKNYSDYSLDIGYYPTNDLRFSGKYDSVEKDSSDYITRVGMKYVFASEKWFPFLKASMQTSESVLIAMEWSKNMQNKSLKMRDEFEDSITTYQVVSQSIAPKFFTTKTTITTDSNQSIIEIDETPTDSNETTTETEETTTDSNETVTE